MSWLIPAAFGLDLLLGDPRGWPHPVVLIGRLITLLEERGVPWISSKRLAGVLLVVLTLAATALGAWALLASAAFIHPWLGGLAALYLSWTVLALRSLHRESAEVIALVEAGRLEEARRSLAMIVGRDTAQLDGEGIVRACIETVAENTSDGVVAPLFYLALGGPILALVYKAANTLDSMVGYLDDRYREIGWAAARFDDLVNLVPARLTGGLLAAAAWLLRLDGAAALRILRRDGRKPASPNAGLPQAAAAGALGLRLGGPASYFGQVVMKPTLGDGKRPVTPERYRQMVKLMYLTALMMLGLALLIWSTLR